MAIVSVARYRRKRKIGDDKSPMVYMLEPELRESKLYSIESLAREIELAGSLSVEDMEHMMQSSVRLMKEVSVAGNKVKVDGLGIFYITLTCPGMEQEKDCTVRDITRVSLRFKADNSLRLVNDSTATTHGGDNNMVSELISKNAPASGGNGDGGDPGSNGGSSGGSGSGGDGREEEAPDPTV